MTGPAGCGEEKSVVSLNFLKHQEQEGQACFSHMLAGREKRACVLVGKKLGQDSEAQSKIMLVL